MSSRFIGVDFFFLAISPFHQLNFRMAGSSQTFHSVYHAQAVAAKATERISAMESSQNSQLMDRPEGEDGIQSQLDFITGRSLWARVPFPTQNKCLFKWRLVSLAGTATPHPQAT